MKIRKVFLVVVLYLLKCLVIYIGFRAAIKTYENIIFHLEYMDMFSRRQVETLVG